MDGSAGATRTVGMSRLAVGAAQGLLLWLIIHQVDYAHPGWLTNHPRLFSGLILTVGFTPAVLLAGLGQMRRLTLGVLALATAATVFGIGAYAEWAQAPDAHGIWPDPRVFLMAGSALFIAHHLVAASDEHRQLRAPYPAYFDIAWKHGVQGGLSVAFTVAFWILIELGASLFQAIGLSGFRTFINHDWFRFIASAVVFAGAVQLTDVRSGMVTGIRTLALTLLSWLMPLMAAITAAFIPALVFTGLKPLAGGAGVAELLLGSAAALIILINAAYQDGEPEAAGPTLIRWGARGAAVILIPLIGLAAFALALRVGEHGLTTERVMAIICVIVGTSYAVGYALAAIRRTTWMKGLETTNIASGYLALAMLLLMLSPVLDPTKIAVADQMIRLREHKIEAAKFDYKFLRFDAGRYGRDALDQLAHTPGPAAELAKRAQQLDDRFDEATTQELQVTPFPAGHAIDKGLVDQNFRLGTNPCWRQAHCVAVFTDIDGDGAEDVILASHDRAEAYRKQDGVWREVGNINGFCPGDDAALAAGTFKPVPSGLKDFEVAGRRLQIAPYWTNNCPKPPPKPGEKAGQKLDSELVRPMPPPLAPAQVRFSSTPPASPKLPAAKPPAEH